MKAVAVFLFLICLCDGIPIDNQLAEDLKIDCNSESIAVQIKLEKPFLGKIFVKDHGQDQECVLKGTGDLMFTMELNFGTCGLEGLKTLNPPGREVSSKLVISFHPLFITKVDRYYHIKCFYKAKETDVESPIAVSDVPEFGVESGAEMPNCSYKILEGSPTGPEARFGVVGQPVYHKWECQTNQPYCMRVHSCFTSNGSGQQVELLDKDGCSHDRHLLQNLEYPGDLLAGQEAHVFKSADRPSMYFQCQIALTLKDPGEVNALQDRFANMDFQQCNVPVCSAEVARPTGFGSVLAGNQDDKTYKTGPSQIELSASEFQQSQLPQRDEYYDTVEEDSDIILKRKKNSIEENVDVRTSLPTLDSVYYSDHQKSENCLPGLFTAITVSIFVYSSILTVIVAIRVSQKERLQ